MSGPAPAVAATRVAVRRVLAELLDESRTGSEPSSTRPLVLVACSGGADSVALAAAVAFEAPRAGVRAGAVVVDHGLQEGSADVAKKAAQTCREVGLYPVEVTRVEVDPGAAGGPEAAARASRYAAFERVANRHGARAVLLAHTLNDQAEQVLLGLMRGSGARSLAGMPERRGLYRRPFLDLGVDVTRAACEAQGLAVWSDPHNSDERFSRVRARRLLEAAEQELGPGVVAGLARSARLLRTDADALDGLATSAADELGPPPWSVEALTVLDPAVRGRVWRLLASHAGVAQGALTSTHVDRLEDLLLTWRGQGGVHLPGGAVVARARGEVYVQRPADSG